MNSGPEHLVLTTPRRSLLFTAVVVLGCIALGVWFISEADLLEAIWSWVAVIVLTAALAACVLMLQKPPQLILTPEGFSLTGMVSVPLIPWRDVETFFVYSEAPSDQSATGVPAHASWRLKPEATARSTLVSRLHRAGGMPIDGGMPRNIGMAPEPLAELLEDWRQRYS